MRATAAWAIVMILCSLPCLAQERLVSQPAGDFGPMPEPLTHVPVQVLESYDEFWHFDQVDRPPLLMVGRLAVSEGDYRRYLISDPHILFEPYPTRSDPRGPVIKAFLHGDLKPRQPRADGPTLVFLRGPQLDRGQDWGPEWITVQGRIVTIAVSAWLDDRPRHKNIPFTRNFVLTLGRLKAGDYELRLVSRAMMERDGTTGYKLERIGNASTRFAVEAAEAPVRWDAPPSIAVIAESDLAPSQVSDADATRLWERPRFAYRGWWLTSALDWTPPGVECGGIDLAEWLKSDLYGAKIPAVSPPEAGKPVFARLVGSLLYGGEWAELRDVTWAGADATIHVDVWCSQSADRGNGIHRPILVVPLERAAAGSRVRVEWNVFNAMPGAGYVDVQLAGEPSARSNEFMQDLRGHSDAVIAPPNSK